ncbi:MAG: ribonuclease H family protein [Bacteroidota bacterium]
MAKKKKFYVVWKGHQPGIYDSWAECQAQIHGFAGAQYKSFPNQQEATQAYREGSSTYMGQGKSNQQSSKNKIGEKKTSSQTPIWKSISVDAACSGNPGRLEYQGVMSHNGERLFHQGPFYPGTQNIGEFLAIVHGLAFLKKHESSLPLYTDSKTAMSWVKNKKIKTTLARTSKNESLFVLVDRAIHWLETNDYETKIIKWDTKSWGEIPADFGRK